MYRQCERFSLSLRHELITMTILVVSPLFAEVNSAR
jgi:hypothetical protein